MRFTYSVFGAAVVSDFQLSGVPEIQGATAEIRIELGRGLIEHAGYDWLYTWREANGDPILSCAHRPDGCGLSQYLLKFPELAEFVIEANTIRCYPQPDCREDTLQHLLLDQIIPRLWAHVGHLVLHASAVELPDGKLIAFLGESGWGKSTLAAALQARGCRLLSDDSICLETRYEGVRVIPSYTGLRLNEDSIAILKLETLHWGTVSHYSDKRRLSVGGGEYGEPIWLDTLYVMTEPEKNQSLSIEAASGAELISTLVRRSFLLDIRDPRSAASQLQEAAAVINTSRVCTLSYPRDYGKLSGLCDLLLAERRR